MTFLILSLLVLAGCTPYKTNFKCPIGEGYPCKSMSYVHEQVKQGKVEIEEKPEIFFPPQSGDHD